MSTCFPQPCACCDPLHICSTFAQACLLVAGGLAAPALAAVAGSVATTIGGSAAAATAVTGMMGSSVGAASMIAGFGYYGGRVTADHMARRIGKFTPSMPLPSCLFHVCMHCFHSITQSCMLSFSPTCVHLVACSSVHHFTNTYAFSPPPFLTHACNQGGFFFAGGDSLLYIFW